MKTTIFMRCQDGVGVVFIKIVVHWQRSMLIVGWFELFLHFNLLISGAKDHLYRETLQSKKFVPTLIGVKGSDFVGRPEAETP